MLKQVVSFKQGYVEDIVQSTDSQSLTNLNESINLGAKCKYPCRNLNDRHGRHYKTKGAHHIIIATVMLWLALLCRAHVDKVSCWS